MPTVKCRYLATEIQTANATEHPSLSDPIRIGRSRLWCSISFQADFEESLCLDCVHLIKTQRPQLLKKRIIIVCSNVQIIETRTQRVNITLIMRYKSSHRPESLSVALSKVWVSLMYKASQSHSNKNKLRNTAANTWNTFKQICKTHGKHAERVWKFEQCLCLN